MTYTRTCAVELFSNECGVTDDYNYQITGVVDSYTSTTIVSSSFEVSGLGDDWLTNGWIEINGRSLKIASHIIDVGTIVVVGVMPSIAVGDAFTAHAGCNRTLDECIAKFSNWLNFRGFPWIPDNEPFTKKVL